MNAPSFNTPVQHKPTDVSPTNNFQTTRRIPQTRYEWLWDEDELEKEKARFTALLANDTPKWHVKIIQRWRRLQIKQIDARLNFIRRIRPNN